MGLGVMRSISMREKELGFEDGLRFELDGGGVAMEAASRDRRHTTEGGLECLDGTGLDTLRNRMIKEQHKGMICSRCCVERGTEGEVWCLGCLRMEEDGSDVGLMVL